MPNKGKGHAVWLDNLFTSSKLLTTLRNYGIGAAGTVRTGRTKREENEESFLNLLEGTCSRIERNLGN